VFAVIADVPHHPDWAKGALRIKNVSESPANLGTSWTQISKIVGKEIEVHAKVNVYEANHRFGFQVDKPIPFQMLWLLEPTAGGTQITVTAEGEPGGFFGVATPVLSKALRDRLNTDLTTLKTRLEAGAQPAG
jgi:hypothetical protein